MEGVYAAAGFTRQPDEAFRCSQCCFGIAPLRMHSNGSPAFYKMETLLQSISLASGDRTAFYLHKGERRKLLPDGLEIEVAP